MNLFGESEPVVDRCWYCGCSFTEPKDCILSPGETERRRHQARVQAALRGVPFDWNARNPKLLQMRTKDHQTPRVRGGRDASDNLVDACLSCNTSKGDKTLEEYREYIYSATPHGRARKLAVEILAVWPDMPEESRADVLNVIARIDAFASKSRFRFFGEQADEIEAEGAV